MIELRLYGAPLPLFEGAKKRLRAFAEQIEKKI